MAGRKTKIGCYNVGTELATEWEDSSGDAEAIAAPYARATDSRVGQNIIIARRK
jgi:hypothetical protein